MTVPPPPVPPPPVPLPPPGQLAACRNILQALGHSQMTIAEYAARYGHDAGQLAEFVEYWKGPGSPLKDAAQAVARNQAALAESARAAAEAERLAEAARAEAQRRAQQEEVRRAVRAASRGGPKPPPRPPGGLGARIGNALRATGRFLVRYAPRIIVGAGIVALVALAAWGGWALYNALRSPGTPTAAGSPTECPEVVLERRACPWTPEGYGVELCGPGFCWDGGPQGSLACKQEESVANAGRTFTNDLVCNEGYAAQRDPCTNVILACVPN